MISPAPPAGDEPRDERARAPSVFGGVGVLDAARAAGSGVSGSLVTRLFRDADEQVPDPATYARALPRELGARVAPPLAGVHPFGGYAANDTARDAFALAALSGRSSPEMLGGNRSPDRSCQQGYGGGQTGRRRPGGCTSARDLLTVAHRGSLLP